MAGEDVEIKLVGIGKIKSELEAAYKAYPDVTILAMRKCGNKLKKIAREQTDAAGVKELTGNLKKGYRFSIPTFGVGSMGMDIRGEFRAETAKNPHMHLIEHGHNIVARGTSGKSGKDTGTNRKGESRLSSKTAHNSAGGRTRAFRMIENTLNVFEPQYDEIMEDCMDKILKKAGLT